MLEFRNHSLSTAFAVLSGVLVLTVATLPVIAQSAESVDEVETAEAGEDVAGGEDAAPASGSVASGSVASGSVERGRYLVHDVAMCVQCHTPRDRRGDLLENRLFDGAPIPVKSPWFGAPRWAFHAPNIQDAPGYTEEQFVVFLTTGIRPNGTEARGPMPPFRMNEEDARAVWEYLKSL